MFLNMHFCMTGGGVASQCPHPDQNNTGMVAVQQENNSTSGQWRQQRQQQQQQEQ